MTTVLAIFATGFCRLHMGPRTRAALHAQQAKLNLVATGELSSVTLAALERAVASRRQQD